MLIDTMFARDMYQVYEINDDLLMLKFIDKYSIHRIKKISNGILSS